MEFEQFIDEAANELEAAGIEYTSEMDSWLETLWRRNVPTHRVAQEYLSRDN